MASSTQCGYKHGENHQCYRRGRHSIEGRRWCALHIPSGLPRDRNEVRELLAESRSAYQKRDLDLCGVIVPGELGLTEIAGSYKNANLAKARFEGGLFITAHLDSLDLSESTVRGSTKLQNECTGPIRLTKARLCNFETVDRSTAKATLDASGARFFGPVTLAGTILQLADFDHAHFAGPLHVTGQLRNTATFRGARLRKRVTITGRFTHLDFSSAFLQEMLSIQSGQGSHLAFHATVTRHEIRLSGHVRRMTFDTATRLEGGISGKVQFEQEVYFCGLHGPVEFSNSSFPRGVTLEGRVLRIRLDESPIGGPLHLRKLACAKDASFRNCEIAGSVTFDHVTVAGTLDMTSSKNPCIKGKTHFKDTSLGDSRFDGREFGDETDLSDCRFLRAPSFRDCKLHTETVLPRTLKSYPDTRSANAAKRYQVLQLLCRQMGWRLEEGVFFALEQRSLRHSKLDPQSDRWLSALYDVSSNYGTNVARAITVFSAGVGLFAAIFAVLDSPRFCLCPVDTNILWSGLLRSLRGAFVPFYELRSPTAWSGIAVLESFLSIPTIAMILIALRWRFRKGE